MPGPKSAFACTLAIAAAMMAGASSSALAQYHPGPGFYVPAPPPPPTLRPRDADAIVRSLGLRPVGRPQGRGSVFVLHALGQEGSPVLVTLDRHTGRVLQILRTGYGSPRIATVPPAGVPPYDAGYDDEEIASLDPDEMPAAGYPGAQRGPSVVTRRGIEADELPPPDVTGSVPRSVYRSPQPRSVDPLVGVPREFRGEGARPNAPAQPRVAARPPEPTPRSAPVPQPRPADAPTVAQKENGEVPKADSKQSKAGTPPAAKEDAQVPAAQSFE